jgi:hypothetical protein
MTKYVRRWSVAGIATTMLGATALAGTAFAQDRGGFNLLQQFAQNVATPNHHGGGGGEGETGEAVARGEKRLTRVREAALRALAARFPVSARTS